MNTNDLLKSMLKIAKSLEENNHLREADKVNDLMVRISQYGLRGVGLTNSNKEKIDQYRAKETNSEYRKRLFQPGTWQRLTDPKNLPWNLHKERKKGEKFLQDRFDVMKKSDEIINNAIGNNNLTVFQARRKAKSDAVNANLNDASKNVYKMDFDKFVAIEFDSKISKDATLQQKFDKEMGNKGSAYFDESGLPKVMLL
jgi:hypothetical protein